MLRMPIPFFINLGMLITMSFLSVGLWSALPADAMLPIHFDVSGTPDNFASSAVALSLLPGAMLLVLIVFQLAPILNKRVLDKLGLLSAIWIFLSLTLAVGHGFIIRGALFALKAAQV